MDKPIRCAIIGQHPMRFPWGFDEEDESCGKMKMELAQQIMVLRQNGVSQFLVACDCGVGLYAAEIVNGLRATTDHDLMLICYTPHEEQATKWAPYLRERYFDMLTACTAASVGINAQIFRVDLDIQIFFDIRHNIQRYKGCLTLTLGIERRDTHQTVYTLFGFHITVCISSIDLECDGFNTGFLPVKGI